MKRMLTTIDLSVGIFSPNVYLCRQILRRLWMDTWSTLLFCSDNTKVNPKQRIVFSSTIENPSCLLSSNGSIAERHAENLKIMRTIGGKKYIQACRHLSAEETHLRQKIYNFYNGPGIASTIISWWKIAFIGLWIEKWKASLHGLEKVSCSGYDIDDSWYYSVSIYSCSFDDLWE